MKQRLHEIYENYLSSEEKLFETFIQSLEVEFFRTPYKTKPATRLHDHAPHPAIGASSEPNFDQIIFAASVLGGWMAISDADVAIFLSIIQRHHGVHEAVGEIGVHVGKFFTVLASTARKDERLFVCDLFDMLQNQNVDHSGKGNYKRFARNVGKVLGLNASSNKFMIVTDNSPRGKHDGG